MSAASYSNATMTTPGWNRLRKVFRLRGWPGVMLIVVLAYIMAALLGSLGWPDEDWTRRAGPSFAPPSWEHWFGTDRLGRSVALKTWLGARLSVIISCGGAAIAVGTGLLLGMLAGWRRGWVDALVIWLCTTLSTVPRLLLLLALSLLLREQSIFGVSLHGAPAMLLALGLTGWVGVCQVVRAEMIKLGSLPFILAARALGASSFGIARRHALPHLTHLILVEFGLRVAGFIGAEVSLSFLGLGPVDQPSWGTMLEEARIETGQHVWWQMTASFAAVLLFSTAVHEVSDALRDVLDPRRAPEPGSER
ncbi:ABC transporter permease [Prosthecobacter fluviatilis]|uniref:ABC transporter permease n=1 Tax=Prosthecobacter fluviatilis TaxID=445931 RepID=A0ABW0KJ87_9BACT